MFCNPRHIVCAVDFSPHTAGVLRAGQFMAQAFNARLTVFHAVSASHDRFPGTTIFQRGGRQDDLLTLARQRIQTVVDPTEDVAVFVAAGDPVEQLTDFCQKGPVDLVIAARRGLSGIKRVLLGSVVERMARRLASPLMVVGPNQVGTLSRRPFRKVVAACDIAEAVSPPLAAAAAVAHRFGARLHLLHAMELPVRPDTLEPTNGPYAEVQAALQQRLHQKLEKLSAATAASLSVTIDILPGPAVEILPPFAREHKADLLVVGVRTCRRLQQWLIGSTTEAALRHVSCAVLTVPTTIMDQR